MRMTKQELNEYTMAIWQPKTQRPLTQEDAREITENFTGFFFILAEWSRKEGFDHAESKARGGIDT